MRSGWPRDGEIELVARRERSAVVATVARDTRDLLEADALDAIGAELADEPAPDRLPGAQLELLFACCHPALAVEAQIALTLRTVAGLTTPEIARAFLVSESALAQRLARAQRKIRDSGVPFTVPSAERMPERLAAVLGVVYLIFTEGHAATAGQDRVRVDLCEEAVLLARLVATLLPGEPEALGLAALVLAHDARRPARVDADGLTVPLDEQDRSRHDPGRYAEAVRLLDRALECGRPGPYQVQAAIACLHTGAPTAGETDWRQIAALYDALLHQLPSAMGRAQPGGGDRDGRRSRGRAGGGRRSRGRRRAGRPPPPPRRPRRAPAPRRSPRGAVAAYTRAIALLPADAAATADLHRRLAELSPGPGSPAGLVSSS